MSLRNKFMANSALSNDGVWIDLEDYPNEDGTVPGFKLGRMSGQNKKYVAFLAEFDEPYLNDSGEPDYDKFGEAIADINRRRTREAFKTALLFNWRNFEMVEEGKKTKYTKSAVEKLVDGGDWDDLCDMLISRTMQTSHFQTPAGKASVKNS